MTRQRKTSGSGKRGKQSKAIAVSPGAAENGQAYDTRVHLVMFRRALCKTGLRRALNPFPDCMRCLIQAQFSGKMAVGAAAAGRFDVCGNSPYLPWNTASGFPGAIDRANNVNTPAGYPLLCGVDGPYLGYRVYGSAIHVTIANEAAVDNLEAVVTAYAGTAHTNLTLAGQSRWAKQSTVGFGDGVVSMVNTLATTEFTGDAQEAILYQTGNAAAYNAYPTSLWFWSLYYSLASAAVTTAQVAIKVTVVYDVVFENPQYDAADLDSITDEDKSAFQLHVMKQALRKKAADQENERLTAAAKLAIEAGATDEGGEERKIDESRLSRASASSSSSSSAVRSKATSARK